MQPRQMRDTSRPVRPSFVYSMPELSLPERRWRSEKRGELVGGVGMPARQRRAVADDVLRATQDAAIVDVGGDGVVGADDVEIAVPHPLDQHVDDLIRGPGARRLFGTFARGHAGEG